MKKIDSLVLSTITAFALIGCGGGGSSGGGNTSGENNSTTQTATLIDDKVSGVKYVNGSASGFTDANGQFPYTTGTVSFYVGDIKLGEISTIPSDKNVFIQDVVGVSRTDTSNAKVLKIASLLQSLDSDNSTDAIEIKEEDFDKFKNQSITSIDENTDVTTLLSNLNITKISDTNAKRHLENSLKEYSVTTDSTPLSLTTSSITNGATNVSIDTSIVLTFSNDVRKNLINKNNITLVDASNNSVDFTITQNFNVVTIKPVSLSYSTSYTLTIKKDIQDYAKNSLGTTDTLISFTTQSQTDTTPPVISSASSFSVNENQTSAFTANATDDRSAVTYSLSGTDSSLFDINSTTGVVTFKTNPDFETKASYFVTLTATDASNNSSSKDVNINIADMDEIAPTITSNSTFTVNENQTSAFTATATDTSGISSYALSGTDASSFNINPTSGEVTFKTAPDFETKPSYSVILTVIDTVNNSSTQNVTINIVNLDETTPTFTSASTVSVNENQLSVITATAIDDSTITYSISGTDESYFDINPSTGLITFKNNPDYETKSSYSITVKATDSSNNVATQKLIVNLNDVDEVAPNITSNSSYSVPENQTSAFQVQATDTSSITYSISGGTDASSFDTNSSTGVVTFKTAPDYESGKISYSLTVKATDSLGNFSTKDVTVNITNVLETTGVFKTGQTTSYTNYDDGYYASTLGVARSFTRDNTKEIVTDNITKLQWQDDATASTTTANWTTATTSTCQNLTLGGYSDWRLPTIEELETIVNYGAVNPSKYTEFQNMASSYYWSSTALAAYTNYAWGVGFDNGGDVWGPKTYNYYVRCVRAGQ